MLLHGLCLAFTKPGLIRIIRPESRSRPASTDCVVMAEVTKEEIKSQDVDTFEHPVFPVTVTGFYFYHSGICTMFKILL